MVVSQEQLERPADADELRLFVAGTLKAIFDGIRDNQQVSNIQKPSGQSAFALPREVEFDIAVTAKSVGAKSGGLKLEVFSVGANAKKEKSNENSTVSRIKFSVPYHYHEGGIR